MTTSKRFDNAITALISAFFNETLAKGTCSACAVGNMVAFAHNKKTTKNFDVVQLGDYNNTYWFILHPQAFFRKSTEQSDRIYEAVVKPTGYSIKEIFQIEAAFEKNTKIQWNDYPFREKSEVMQDQFNGLMAVVDELCKLDGIEDASQYKKLFIKENV